MRTVLQVVVATGVDVFPVQHQHACARDFEPSAARNPVLDGDILAEDVLVGSGRGLDFDQIPRAAVAHQHVDAGIHALVLDGGLVDGRDGFIGHQATGRLYRWRALPRLESDQFTTRVAALGQFADARAAVEDGLLRVRPRGCQVATMDVVPEPQLALQAGDEARLAQARNGGPARLVGIHEFPPAIRVCHKNIASTRQNVSHK